MYKKDRHRAEIQSHRAQAHQVRRDTGSLATNNANGLAARGNIPAHQFLHGQRVSDVVRQRREVIQPIGVRHELVVLHVLGDFFVAAMQKTDVRRGFGDDFAIELEHESQNAVRRRMRRPHVEDHLLADVVVAVCRSSASAATTRVTGSGDSISRVVKGIQVRYKPKR